MLYNAVNKDPNNDDNNTHNSDKSTCDRKYITISYLDEPYDNSYDESDEGD